MNMKIPQREAVVKHTQLWVWDYITAPKVFFSVVGKSQDFFLITKISHFLLIKIVVIHHSRKKKKKKAMSKFVSFDYSPKLFYTSN